MDTLPVPVDFMQVILPWKERLESDMQGLLGCPVEVRFAIKPIVLSEKPLRMIICNVFDVTWSDILRKTRKREIVEARHTYCYFCRAYMKKEWKYIADSVGFDDHSSAMHSYRTVKDWLHTKYEPYGSRFTRVKDQLLTTSIHNLKP